MAAIPPAPPDVLEIFLGPGEFWFGGERTRIRTLLGSCVAIVLWQPLRRIGGMCHYLLPHRPVPEVDAAPDGRYADEAMALFMQQLRLSGTSPGEYQAKLFGGGEMFVDVPVGRRAHDVARRNMDAARALLLREGFHVLAEDLGGRGHRNLVFDVWSGDVWLKRAYLPRAAW